MRINRDRIRQLLQDFEFETLFIEELGWDRHSQTLPIQVNEAEYALTACAEKRGMVAFPMPPHPRTQFPTMRRVARLSAKSPSPYTNTSSFTPTKRKPLRSGNGSSGRRANLPNAVNSATIETNTANRLSKNWKPSLSVLLRKKA